MSDGLDGVVAAQTVLSHADAERGIARRRAWFRRVSGARTYGVAALAARFARQRGVWVRGRPIDELVTHEGYEGTVALLWEGFAGDGLTRAEVAAQLGAGRVLAFSRLED